MSVPNCTALIPDSRLYGTANADQVRISKADGADGLAGKVKVEINGQTRVMDQKELANLRLELGAGNDTVTIDAGIDAKGMRVNGGSGTLHMNGNTNGIVDVTGKDNAEVPKPFRIPGTMITVIPLEAAKQGESLKLFGMELPFKSARITNESCFTALPPMPKNTKDLHDAANGKVTQPGQPTQSTPHFNLTVSTDRARLDVTDRVPLSLHPKEVPGTPLNGKIAEGNLRKNELVNPSISVGDRLVLNGTLSVRDPYPSHYISPTELNVTLTSENFKSITPKQHGDKLDLGQVGRVKVEAFGIGGAKGDISMSFDLTRIDAALKSLNLKPGQAQAMRQEIVDVIKAKFEHLQKNHSAFDLMGMLGPKGDLAKSLKPVFDKYVPADTKPSQVDRAIKDVLSEISHPGVTVKGPMYMGVPIGYGHFSADSTRPIRAPLAGSGIGTPFPATLLMVGPTMIPAGVLSDIASPAGGVLLARDGKSTAISATIAGKPTLEPTSMGVAGVASLRGGFQLGGFDITGEVSWRGRAALGGGSGVGGGDSVRRDVDAIAGARMAAERRAVEAAEGHEKGQFRPDYTTPQVTGNDVHRSEGYIGVTIKKTWK